MQDIGELQHDKPTESIKNSQVLTLSPVLHEGVTKRGHTSIGTFEKGTQSLSPGVAGLLSEEKGPTSAKSPLWRLVKRGKGRKAKEKMVGTSSGEDLDAEVGRAVWTDARAIQEQILASPEAQELQKKNLSQQKKREKEEARKSQQLTRKLYQQWAPEIHAWEQAQSELSSSHIQGLRGSLEAMTLEQGMMLPQDRPERLNDLRSRVRLPEVGDNDDNHSSTASVIHLPSPPHNSPHSPTRAPESFSNEATQPRKRSTEEVHTPWQLGKRGKPRHASDYDWIEGMDDLSNELMAGVMECLQGRAFGTLQYSQPEHKNMNMEPSNSKKKVLAAFDKYTPRTEVGRVFKKKVRELLEQHPLERVKKILQKVKSHEDSQRPEIREAIDECDRMLGLLIANSDQGNHYRGSSSSGSTLSLPAQSAESATMLPNSISNFITRPRKRSTEEVHTLWQLVKRGNSASKYSEIEKDTRESSRDASKVEKEAGKIEEARINAVIAQLDNIARKVLGDVDLENKNYASSTADDSQHEYEDVDKKSRMSEADFQKALESFTPQNALEPRFKAWFCQNFKKLPPQQAQFALTKIKEEVGGEATDVHAALHEYDKLLRRLLASGKTHKKDSHGGSSSDPTLHIPAPSAHSRRMPSGSTPLGSMPSVRMSSARMPSNELSDNTRLQKRSKEPAGDDFPDLKEARLIDRLFQHADTCENVCRDAFEALKVIIPAKAVRGALMNQPSESPLEASTSTTSRITKASLPQPASQQNERPDERPFEAQVRSRRGSSFGKRTTVLARESGSSTDEQQLLQQEKLPRRSSSRQELVEGIRRMSLTGAQESDAPPEQRELSIEQKTAERRCEYQLRECFLRIAYNISDMPGRRTLSADDAVQNLQVDLGIRAEDNDASLPHDEELLVQKFRNDRRDTSNLVRKATIDRVIKHIYERNGVFKPNDWHELEDPASSSSSRRTSSHMASLSIQKEHEWPNVYQKMAENEKAEERRRREEEQKQHEDAENDSVDRRNQHQALSVMSGALVKATKVSIFLASITTRRLNDLLPGQKWCQKRRASFEEWCGQPCSGEIGKAETLEEDLAQTSQVAM